MIFHSVLVQNEEFSGILRRMSLSSLANMSSSRLGKCREKKPLGKDLELIFHYLSLISIDAGIIRWLGEVFHCKVFQKTTFNKKKVPAVSFCKAKFFKEESYSTLGKLLREGCSKNVFCSQQNL